MDTDLLDDAYVPQKELMPEALSLYSKTKLDYAGCIYIAEAKTRNEDVLTSDKKMISRMKQMGIPEQEEKACRTDDNQKPFWIQKDQSINELSTNCQRTVNELSTNRQRTVNEPSSKFVIAL